MDSTVPIKNEVLLLARENVKNSINVYPIDSLSAEKHTHFETMFLRSFNNTTGCILDLPKVIHS